MRMLLRLLGVGPSVFVLFLPAIAAAQPPPQQQQPPPPPPDQQQQPPPQGAYPQQQQQPPPQGYPPQQQQQQPPPGYGQQPPPAYGPQQPAGYPPQGGVPVVQQGGAYGPPVIEEEPRPAPNSLFAEGFGAGLYYSLNYERLVVDSLGVRVGFSYISLSASAGSTSSTSSYLGFPLTVSFIGVGGGRHRLELGGGATIAIWGGSASGLGASSSGSGVLVYGTGMIGYRIHPVGGAGFMFRVGLMGLAGKGLSLSSTDPDGFGVLPYFYISAGASF